MGTSPYGATGEYMLRTPKPIPLGNKVLTWDLETTTKKSMKRTANPFDEDNWVVASGWQYNNGPKAHQYWTEKHNDRVLPDLTDVYLINGFNIKFDLLYAWDDPELQAFFKRGGRIYDGQYMEYLLDGMIQDSHMLSMNEVAARYYDGGQKIDAVKEMWAAGISTENIPRDLLIDYLIGDNKEVLGDIENTYRIFCHQVKRAQAEMHPNFMQMFNHRMDGLLATTEMESNGIFNDREVSERERDNVVERVGIALEELTKYIPELPPELTFNWGSPNHKSALIFGGVVKYEKWTAHADEHGNAIYSQKTVQWPLFEGTPLNPEAKHNIEVDVTKPPKYVTIELRKHKRFGEIFAMLSPNGRIIGIQDRYQSGKKANTGKFKNMQVNDLTKMKGAKQPYYFKFDGYTKGKKSWVGAKTDAYDNPLYSTAGEVIEELATRGVPFCTALGKYTGLAKDLSTYYWVEDKHGKRKGMLTLVGDNGIIHHKLNHTSTVTGRMSANDPNMQNIPRGDKSTVKKGFRSRFKDGKLAEIDYSQLEVVIQGVLSGDIQLTKDLQDRIDFHCKRLAKKLGREYEDIWKLHHEDHDPDIGVQRTGSKEFSFQRAYGAGAPAISASTGMSLEDVKALITAEEALYGGVVEFDRKLESIIAKNRIPTGSKLYVDGVPFSQGTSHWDCPTGTRFVWTESITPAFMHDKGKFTGFSPPERKNYPVQGVGGEVVQTMLGKVWRYFIANDRFNGDVLLVNTVHDCVILDGKDGPLQVVAKNVQNILEQVPVVYNKAFSNMNIVVPFPCETEVGDDLFDMTAI